jgi:hypothetical protein
VGTDKVFLVPSGTTASNSSPQIYGSGKQTAPINEGGLIDFAAAFSTFRTRSTELAACPGCVGARDSGLQATVRKPAPAVHSTLKVHQGFTELLLERCRSCASGVRQPGLQKALLPTRGVAQSQLRCRGVFVASRTRRRCDGAAVDGARSELQKASEPSG